MFVCRANGFVQRLPFGVGELLALALELFDLDFDEGCGRRLAAHHGVAGRGPGENESRS